MGKRETEVEQTHGHCADVLMDDYGVPKRLRVAVCEEVAKVWRQNTMIHCLIIASVRGYQPHPVTRGLQSFLERHATLQEPKNHKATVMRRHEEPKYSDGQQFDRQRS